MGFSKSFLWGITNTAHQIEGAYEEGGKEPGIWDILVDGRVKHGDTGAIACDHYHRYREDVALMKQMGIKAYRFSVSWSRIIPEKGRVNETGLQFYRNLVRELLVAGITPICVLYDWNLPMWLHEKGGWLGTAVSDHFAEFTEIVVGALSGQLSIWITLNEPAAFMGNGYLNGVYAPFETSPDGTAETLERMTGLTTNILLAHGKAAQMIRSKAALPPQVGIAVGGTLLMPRAETEKEIRNARAATFSGKADYHLANWWLDPIVDGRFHESLAGAMSTAERKVISLPLDFIGYNGYQANNYDDNNGWEKALYPGMPRTATDWLIIPDTLYWAVRFLHERYRLPILISENGMANIDFLMEDGRIHDQQRIEYLKGYLKGLKRAAIEGYPVTGYMYRSFLDSFEWEEGYAKRFGLIYVDYRSNERVPKDSALWYTKIIRDNGATI